jgi:hypothetical protein
MSQLALGFKKAIYVGEGSNVFYTVRIFFQVSSPRFVVCNSDTVLGAPGRPRRSLQARLCTHNKP